MHERGISFWKYIELTLISDDSKHFLLPRVRSKQSQICRKGFVYKIEFQYGAKLTSQLAKQASVVERAVTWEEEQHVVSSSRLNIYLSMIRTFRKLFEITQHKNVQAQIHEHSIFSLLLHSFSSPFYRLNRLLLLIYMYNSITNFLSQREKKSLDFLFSRALCCSRYSRFSFRNTFFSVVFIPQNSYMIIRTHRMVRISYKKIRARRTTLHKKETIYT